MFSVNHELLATLGVDDAAFEGQVALITGGARGIGEGVAMTLAALGARIVIIDRLERGAQVAEAIARAGGEATFLHGDLTDFDRLPARIEAASAAYGPIDILINNALRLNAMPFVAQSIDEWDLTFATNLRVPVLLTQALLPGMLERRRGRIVNLIAYEGIPMAQAYSATKVGLRSLGLSLAREIGHESGVSVFSFVPGIVDTPLVREVIIPQTSEVFGITEEQAIAAIAQNPGYSGFVPVDHCVSALVYALAHAPEYHGQVADPFEPLDRHGVIDLPAPGVDADIDAFDVSGPLWSRYLKQYLGEVTSLNRELEQRIDIRTRELSEARARSERLLLNILPPPIAERLKEGEKMIADHFNDVTVLFADIVGFTPLSTKLPPRRVVEILDAVFSQFDLIAGRYELEKIKTIGDCYMAVGGIPKPHAEHADRVARAALEMLPTLSRLNAELGLELSARIGVHSGSVVAGVIGQQKFIYDLWGDTVNIASRMESHGVSDRIQCTEQVHERLRARFDFEPRGEIEVKGKGPMPTYFLVGAR